MSTQNTWLTKNPFYLLNVSCTDNRRAIISAADELGLMLDAEECSNAQNALLNPAKRLSAELDWFIDSDASATAEIRRSIQSGEMIPGADRMNPISGLNAQLYNLPLQKGLSFIELGFFILSIDQRFCAIDTAALVAEINRTRELAKLSPVTEQDISFELDKKRGHIRQVIQDTLQPLQEEDYIKLIVYLAEYYGEEADMSECTIISDVIDQYELRMQAEIDKATQEIETHIERIKRLGNTEAFRSNIQTLITRVRKWDKLVQPLQLKSMASGMPHKTSEDLGYKLRNLSLFLNNEKDLTEEALMLTNALREIFSEIGTLADRLKEDSVALQKRIREDKETAPLMRNMEALKKEAGCIQATATVDNVSRFLRNLKTVNARIKAAQIDSTTKTQAREAICYIARELAITLHNNKGQTDLALQIAEVLLAEFGDMSTLKQKLSEDHLALTNMQIQKKRKNQTTKFRAVVWLAIIAIAVASVLPSCGDNLSTSYTPSHSSQTPSKTTNAPSEVKFTGSNSSGTKVYADIVSIFPGYGIYTEGNSTYHSFVCECKTSSGEWIWVYMSTSEYRNNFDSTASTSVTRTYAEEVTFSKKRIHGSAYKADYVLSGLAEELGTTMVLDFSSIS